MTIRQRSKEIIHYLSVCLFFSQSVCQSIGMSVTLRQLPVLFGLTKSINDNETKIKRNHSLFSVCLSFSHSVCHSMKGWLPVLFGLTKSINDNKTKLPRNLTKPLQTLQRFQNALHWKENYLSIMKSKTIFVRLNLKILITAKPILSSGIFLLIMSVY